MLTIGLLCIWLKNYFLNFRMLPYIHILMHTILSTVKKN